MTDRAPKIINPPETDFLTILRHKQAGTMPSVVKKKPTPDENKTEDTTNGRRSEET